MRWYEIERRIIEWVLEDPNNLQHIHNRSIVVVLSPIHISCLIGFASIIIVCLLYGIDIWREDNMLHIETKRELVTDDGKRFPLFSNIAFNVHNEEVGHSDRVICRIIGMSDSDYRKNNGYIVADEVEINRCESNQCVFYFKDMQDVNYVCCD